MFESRELGNLGTSHLASVRQQEAPVIEVRDTGRMPASDVRIVPAYDLPLSADEIRTVEAAAAGILAGQPDVGQFAVFGDNVACGDAPGPKILFSNNQDIALVEQSKPSMLEYRMSLLAGDGDLFVLRGERNPAYEAYRDRVLGLGKMHVVEIPPALQRRTDFTPERFAEWLLGSQAMAQLMRAARHAGAVNIVPYIGSGAVWRFAKCIAEHCQVKTWVSAPPPRLTRLVNDKLWFIGTAAKLLGKQSVPATHQAYGPAGLTALVMRYAERYPCVVVKVPDSAGSRGNIVLRSSTIKHDGARYLQSRLLHLLRGRGWRDRYPLMVEAWDQEVLSNPSVQIWVPLQGDGEPIVEGIFEQALSGDDATFVGATQTTLSLPWQSRLVNESLKLATLIQLLGYYGRVSFDAVVTGACFDSAGLHWIECNGRWGGVSLPMTAINRLTQGWAQDLHYVIVQHMMLSGKPISFDRLLSVFGNEASEVSKSHQGIIFLSPAASEAGQGMHFAVLAKTAQCAMEKAKRVQTKLSMTPLSALDQQMY